MATLRLVTAATTANPNVHDLYLDDSGQLELIGDDLLDTESYARCIAQRIKCRILLIRGEWYLDQRIGTPWKESILTKGTTATTLRRILRQVIEGTPGVKELRSLTVSMDAATRSATITQLQIEADTRILVTVADLDNPLIIEAPHG